MSGNPDTSRRRLERTEPSGRVPQKRIRRTSGKASGQGFVAPENRMVENREPNGEVWSPMGPHEEFLELCALSAGGGLTPEEQKKLDEHLAGCSECREARKQFETVVDQALPALAPELAPETPPEDSSFSQEAAEACLGSLPLWSAAAEDFAAALIGITSGCRWQQAWFSVCRSVFSRTEWENIAALMLPRMSSGA